MTYLALALIVLGLAALFAVLVGRGRRHFWPAVALAGAVMIALTAIFDNVMIAADLFRYAPAHLSGVHLGLAPIEDFAWPAVAVLVLPAIWELLDREER